MKEKINQLRERLHDALEEDDKEEILKISEELDRLIAIYYKNKEENIYK